MSYTDFPQFDGAVELSRLSEDYAEAKAAQRELKEMRKVMWLLLMHIGEPISIDRTSILQVPDDAQILEMMQPNEFGVVTLHAK